MERIAALVEGDTEDFFFRSTYGRVIVQRPFPNGRSVDLDRIIDDIKDNIDTLGGSIRYVIILLDREGRDASAAEMAVRIKGQLQAVCTNREIMVRVTDRHIENWILADEEFIITKFDQAGY